jgi:DNA polymerase-3 subunit gamma/tau
MYLWGHEGNSRRLEVFIETNYKALKKLKKLDRRMDDIMGVLDGLAVALEELKLDSATVVARVAEDFAFLKAQIAELTIKIDELVAGQVDPAQVLALQELVGEIGVTVEGIEDIPNPVPEPDPEPEPEPEPVPEEPPVV